uniref:protein-tyrosine-phosphatase n=1 Tax=Mesocestoides corti TaxID=53468 RepID=A0A5K3F4M5_MESCO
MSAILAERFRPHFTSVPAPQQVVAPGSRLALSCTAVGVPVPNVAWFEGPNQLYRHMLDRQPPGTARLALSNVTQSMNVSCIASSMMGQVEYPVSIVVKELPPPPEQPRFLPQNRPGEVTFEFNRPTTHRPAPQVSAYLVQWIESRYFLADYLVSLSPEIATAIQRISTSLFPPHLPALGLEKNSELSQVGLQFRVIPVSEIENGLKEVKCQLTGLKPYTNYTAWCRSIGANGDVSTSTQPIHLTTDQAAPSSSPLNVQASAISNVAVSVSWDQPLHSNGPITMYRVYYTDDPKRPLAEWNIKLVQVDYALSQSDAAGSTSTLTLITHLRSNATYYIRVSASNIKGDGPTSSPYRVIVRPGALPPPVNFKSVSKSAHEVSLHWDTPETPNRQPPLVKYELLVTPLDGEGNFDSTSRQVFIEPSSSSYLVTDLLPNTRYEFRLAAVSETGAGIQAETTAKTKEYVPGPPNLVTVTATGSDRLLVTWTPPKESISASLLLHMGHRSNELRIAYYDIDLRATDAKGNWLSGPTFGVVDQQRPIRQQMTSEREIEEARGKLTYSREITGLEPGTHYVVHIRAVSRSGSGDRAKSSPIMTWPLPPGQPRSLELRTVASTLSRRRILQAQWRAPVDEEDNASIGTFRYRVRWTLLLPPRLSDGAHGLYQPEGVEPLPGQVARELGVSEEFVFGEENVTQPTWESPPAKLLGGLSYEVRVATMDNFQTGEEASGRIELPDEAPTLPPSGVRIDATSPQLLLQWKAPPLEARNGRLVAYDVECAWVDVTAGIAEAWHTKRVKLAESGGSSSSTLFWPPGRVSLLNISTPIAASFGTVYRGRVRATTSAGPGPWSEFVTLSLKNMVPKVPTSVDAVFDERRGVYVTWAMPEHLVQTSFNREAHRTNLDSQPPIYRRFVVEYANRADATGPTQWQTIKTAGPVTVVALPITEKPEQHVVRVRSVGIANLHSDWSPPVPVRKSAPSTLEAVEDLKCQAVAQAGNHAELELAWSPVELPAASRLLHYVVNYTGGRVYLNSDGHRMRESQGEREQSLRVTARLPHHGVAHRLRGLKFNMAYQIDVTPVFERSIKTGSLGESRSVFCRTHSKPPQFVPTPEFHRMPAVHENDAGLVVIYRADEQNGTVSTYEILVRESNSVDGDRSPAVLAQFPAVTLFPPLTKMVRVVLNGSSSGPGLGGVGSRPEPGMFSAPSLMPGQAYDFALRACIESHEVIDGIADTHEQGSRTTVVCSMSDWTAGPGVIGPVSPRPDQSARVERIHLEEDDPLWPPIVLENITAASSTHTPFNDAASVSRTSDQEIIPTDVVLPLGSDAMHPQIPASTISPYSDRIQIIVAALSIIVGVTIMAFILILILRHYQRRQRGVGKADRMLEPIKPPRSIAQSASNLINGYTILDTPMAQKRCHTDALSLQSAGFNSYKFAQPTVTATASLDRRDYVDASSGRFNSFTMMRTPMTSIGETPNCACSATASQEMLSPPISRQPPPPYFMNHPPPLIPGILEANHDIASHAIPVEGLPAHVSQLKQNQGLLMSAEFESIDPGGQFTWEHSSRPANRPKNRYANVVTYDHSRVVLSKVDGDFDSDYINANYLDGYNRKNAYIATQGPLPNTVCDFWRMVWEQRTSTIVAMTRLEERERIKCEQYWPTSGLPAGSRLSPTKGVDWLSPRSTMIAASDSSQTISGTSPIATTTYGQITVSLMEVVELAYYTVRTFTVQKSGHREKREIRQLQFTAWPDHGVPNHPAPFLMFLRRVNAEFVPDVGPIVVHCSAGVGRTGAYIVLDILLQQLNQENSVNVFAVVAQLRSQRNFIVQTEDQYAFIYETLLEASLSGNTELPARQLRMHWHKLTAPCSSAANRFAVEPTNDPLANTGLALEFSQLVTQTVGAVAAAVAHKAPGGLLACCDDLVDSGLVTGDTPSGALPVNVPKNRRGEDLIPYDSNRVKLSAIRGVDGSDYINASYIDSYRSRAAFIATQTPLPAYVEDFWRMVWETVSCIIVQLDTSEVDNEPSYWPMNEAARFGFLVLEPVAAYDMTAYVLREFRLTDAKSGQSRIIRVFDASQLSFLIGRVLASARHINQSGANESAAPDVPLPPSLPPLAEWLPSRASANNTPTFGFMNGGPASYYRSLSADNYKRGVFDDLSCQKAALALIDLIEQVHKTQEKFGLDGPITVHCRSGTGYTGIFLALSILFDRMRCEGVVDAFQTTKLLWWQRRGLVEVPTEYAFCYAAALEYVNLYEPVSASQVQTQTPSSSLS